MVNLNMQTVANRHHEMSTHQRLASSVYEMLKTISQDKLIESKSINIEIVSKTSVSGSEVRQR